MSSSFAALDRALGGRVHQPGTPGFGAACAGFDLSAIPAPDVAVCASEEADVTAAVRFAADHGLPVAVRATGHGPIPDVRGGLLVDTRAMSAVAVDPARRTATIGCGRHVDTRAAGRARRWGLPRCAGPHPTSVPCPIPWAAASACSDGGTATAPTGSGGCGS